MVVPSVHPQGCPKFSLIVATKGRVAPLQRLFKSLEAQHERAFEVIVVDQNDELDLSEVRLWPWTFALTWLTRLDVRGVSAARNAALSHAKGTILVFPDDDCWYPPGYLRQVGELFRGSGAQLITGRAADPAGRTINGRFRGWSGPIDRASAFTTQIEWNMAIDARLMRDLGGYDPGISLGGETPWQGGEGYDLILRALQRKAACHFDHDLIAHHEELSVAAPDEGMVWKGRAYGRGLGFVLRKHEFGAAAAAWWIGRSLANLMLAGLSRNRARHRYFVAQLTGRIEGLAGRTFGKGG